MKKIEIFEKAMNEGGSLKDYGINSTFVWVSCNTQETGKALKENGISEFTISSTFSSLIETLAAFEKEGIRMAGLTEVNATYSDWKTGKKARIPAIRMTLEF